MSFANSEKTANPDAKNSRYHRVPGEKRTYFSIDHGTGAATRNLMIRNMTTIPNMEYTKYFKK
ncbi:MAG: hypothetical protein NVSMB28_13390 [Collimonas sp.]